MLEGYRGPLTAPMVPIYTPLNYLLHVCVYAQALGLAN